MWFLQVPWLGWVAFTGFACIFTWSVGNLTDQAILRLLSTELEFSTNNASIYYFDTSMENADSIFSRPAAVNPYGVTANVVFQTAVLSAPATLNRTSDVWGNVKIPLLQDIKASLTDSNGWLRVPNYNVSYTSLIGNPVYGVPSEGSSTFTIWSSYFSTTCSDPILYGNETDEFTWPVEDGSQTCAQNSPPVLLGGNRKSGNVTLGTCSVGSLSDNQWNASDTSDSQLRTILFQQQGTNGVSAFNCSIEYFTAESFVECQDGSNCAVTYIRAANSSTPSWNSPLDNCLTAQNFYTQFASACQPFEKTPFSIPVPSILEVYLMFNDFGSTGGRAGPLQSADLYQLSGAVLSDRFTRVLNSFWTASIYPDFVPGTISTFDNDTDYDPGVKYTTSGVIEASALVVTSDLVYVCNTIWAILLVASSVCFVLLALLAVLFKYKVNAPDVFKYSTSVMRARRVQYVEPEVVPNLLMPEVSVTDGIATLVTQDECHDHSHSPLL
jgi:hypothetical protein